jgi:hydrogenase maturation protease
MPLTPPEGPAEHISAPAVEPPPARQKRVLVAGVGNVLRGDDGFGPAVTERLGHLPAGADVVETGIGGIALLQELMAGCDALVLIDAVDREAEPGTVFLITPEIREAVHVPDVHLANPDRVLSMAKTMGVLPDRVLIVGCQPYDMDELGAGLSPAVERAVAIAVTKVEEAVDAWL